MVSLLDIAPQSDRVKIGNDNVDVFGLSVQDIAALFKRFPELQRLALNQALTFDQIRTVAPNAIGSIIAAGCGLVGNEHAEETAGKLPIEAQLDLLTKIGGLTFPSGIGPFVKRIEALSQAVSGEVSKAAATKSQARSKS